MIWHHLTRRFFSILGVVLAAIFAPPALAQPATAPAPAFTGYKEPAPVFGSSSKDKPPLMKEELEQLLAPIALYPDSLLTQMLMASTYPLEVVQADRWVKAHKDLKGDALAKELEKQDWDASVKSLVNFPEQLSMTRNLRKVAVATDNAEFLPMFAGQAVALTRTLPAAELVRSLVAEVHELLP